MTEILRTDTPKKFSLPPGNVLSIDAAAGSGHTGKLDHPGAQAASLKAIAAGTTFRIGPYRTTTYHYVAPLAGEFAITELPAEAALPVSGTPTDVVEMFDTGAPVDYMDGTPPATGEGMAGPGSRYTDKSTGRVYTNIGTKAAPAWTLIGLPLSGAPTDVLEMFGEGAPVDYTDGDPAATGEGVAGKGSRYTDLTNATLYMNTGTKAEPAWTQFAPVA